MLRKRRRTVKLGYSKAQECYTEATCDKCSRRREIPASMKPKDGLAALKWQTRLEITETGNRTVHHCDDCVGSWRPLPAARFALGAAREPEPLPPEFTHTEGEQ